MLGMFLFYVCWVCSSLKYQLTIHLFLTGFWTVIRKADNVVEIKNAVAYDFALDFKKRRLREVYKIYLKVRKLRILYFLIPG